MAQLKLKWNTLFNMPELDFEGDFPATVTIPDNIQLTLAWLTGATRSQRKLIRCDENGALLFSQPWNGLITSNADILEVGNSSEDTATFTFPNNGVLVATGANLLQAFFKRANGADDEEVFIPSRSYYWFPGNVYSVRGRCVPYTTGGDAVHGATAFI